MSEEFILDYKALKSRIIRSCIRNGKEIVDFKIDFEKLTSLCDELGIVPLHFGLDAKRIIPDVIPYLNEYFKDDNLSWFTDNKFSTAISFIRADAITEEVQELLDKLKVKQEDEPEVDKVNIAATILAKYPCYTATVVSYKSNNPKFIKANKPSYVIQIRANKVVIVSSDYQYNYKDMS